MTKNAKRLDRDRWEADEASVMPSEKRPKLMSEKDPLQLRVAASQAAKHSLGMVSIAVAFCWVRSGGI